MDEFQLYSNFGIVLKLFPGHDYMEIGRSKKLLLVEDEAIIAIATSKMLSRRGYDVITAKNGREAVETALTDTSIDLILMDIDLGEGINGPEAARQILEIQNIPIVFLTSHSEQEVVEMVREITRYGYVIKNSGNFVLLSSIDMAFELFDSHERLKASADYLRASEEKVKSKLDSILSPEGDIGDLELAEVVDVHMLQSIMNDFYELTEIGIAILNLKGDVLVSTGWQDICTKFHRVNPDSCRNCIDSDRTFSNGVAQGNYKLYKCRNNMWDMATPIEVGGKHVGNLFLGQFLFNDEVVDYELFRSQAKLYGFDEKEYIAALDRVPRWERDKVFNAMTFYIKLLNIISRLSYSNIKLAKTLSERDRFSDLHKESEARLVEITNNMVDLVARIDAEGFFEYVSPSYEKILGYRPEELMGTWPPDIFHPSRKEQNIKDILKICSAGEGSAEFRLRHKDGTYRWFEATGRNVYDLTGKIIGAVLGARDITKRKIAEKSLGKKDKQYKDLFESMIDGFAIHEIVVDDYGHPVDYIFLEVNPAFERHTGLSAADLIGKKVTELMPDIEPYWIETYGQVALSGVQLTIENFSRSLNRWFKVTAYSPQRGFFAAIFEDITDRKKGEELLKEKDERYKRLFNSVVGYVYTVYIENKIAVKTLHGPGCEAITGYTPEDFIADPELWYKMIYPDDRGRVILFASDIINKGVFNFVEHRINCRDGSLKWVRNTPVPHYDAGNNLIEYDSIIADITERKVVESFLKESEARYRYIIDKNPLSIFLIRNGKYIYANTAARESLGYKYFSEISNLDFNKSVSSENMDEITKRTVRLMSGETNDPMELTIVRPDGTQCLMETGFFPITLSDGPAMLVMAQNITRSRKLEKEIAVALEKYRTVADFTYDWEFWVGPDGEMIYCSPSCERITGYSRDEFSKDPDLLKSIIIDDLESPCVDEGDAYVLPEINETEFRITKKDGSVRWISHVCTAVYDDKGNFKGRRGSNRDITGEKHSRMGKESTLAMLNDLWDVAKIPDGDLKSICDHILTTIVRITKSRYGFYGFINDDETEMTIYSWSGEAMKDCSMAQKPEKYKISDCGIWAEAVRLRSDLIINDYSADHTAKKGYPAGHVKLENIMVMPVFVEGKIKSVAAVANSDSGYNDSDKMSLKIFTTNIYSVILKKQIEERLRDSEIKLKAMINSTTDGVCMMTLDGIVIESNKTLADRFGVTTEELSGSDIYSFFKPDIAASRRKIIEEIIRTGLPAVFEDVRDGIYLESHMYPVKNSAGELISIANFSRDVTENKESFKKIQSLLKEKELLLHEVHHRIKNNMSTISGLLMLQAASMSDSTAVTALNDARSRVQSMMIMYDKLYRSEDYRKMSVKEYFEKFIDEIYVIFENSRQVRIEKDIQDFILDTKILFPLGIIINEIITNSFKYAFSGGREGVINVSVKKMNDEITISIKDNGAGVPEKVLSSKTGGFGLNLVSALTGQIGGTVKITNDNGTKVEIVFTPEV